MHILSENLPGLSVGRSYWFDDESKALLFLSYEGTGWWAVVDVQSGTLVYLGEMSDYEGHTSEKPFAVSPDGRTLAVEDVDRRLLLVSAEDGAVTVVEKGALWYAPSWSTDGGLLYYWAHSSEGLRGDWEEIRVYDVERDQISALLDRSAAAGLQLYSHDYFSVSPNGDYILFWRNRLRLVKLGR